VAALGVPVTVEAIGHADPLPLRAGSSYRDNAELGLARATRVAGLLFGSGLSTDAVFIGTRGDAAPPFSNDTSEGRLRNRTVTLRISLAA
jgi:flagellar motor protein MotB